MGGLLAKQDNEESRQLTQLKSDYKDLRLQLFSQFKIYPPYVTVTLAAILKKYKDLLVSELNRSSLLSPAQKKLTTLSLLKEITLILCQKAFAEVLVKTHQMVSNIEALEKNTETDTDVTGYTQRNINKWKADIETIISDASVERHYLVEKSCKNAELGKYDPKYALLNQLHRIFNRYTNNNKMLVVQNLLGSIKINSRLLAQTRAEFYDDINNKLTAVETYEANYYRKSQGCFSFFSNYIVSKRQEASSLNPLLEEARNAINEFSARKLAR